MYCPLAELKTCVLMIYDSNYQASNVNEEVDRN